MTNDATKTAKWFGNDLRYKQVTELGVDLGTPDTFANQLGHRDSSEITDEPTYEEVKADNNKVITYLLDERTPKITGNVLQSDKVIIDFLSDQNLIDEFYAVVINLGKVNGKQQLFIAPICQFKPSMKLTAGTRKPPYELSVRENINAITIPFGEIDSYYPEVTANITIGAGEFYYIFEEA